MAQHDCLCAECELTFNLPAIAICPYCSSRQVRRLSVEERAERDRDDAGSIRKTAAFHRRHGDSELADAWDRVASMLEARTVPQ
jgi:hypothetical protein